MSACWCSSILNKTYQQRGRNVWLDEVKQAAVESRQGRAFVVRNQPSSASTADHRTANRGAAVDPAKSVRDLGIHIDGDQIMRTRVKRTMSHCFAALRQLRQIRSSVPPATFLSLVVTLVLSRLDYGNAVLIGLPAYLVRRLQTVLYAAAGLIYHIRSADHITDALASLHWLHVPEWIEYKVAVLTYNILHRSAPQHLGPLVPVADLPSSRTLCSAGTNRLLVPPVRLSTVGNRAFTVAGPRVWNTLPEDVTTSQSLTMFCRHLKTWLFRKSYPDIIL